MKVPIDFGDKVQGLASSTPRTAIENLLRAMLPREPVRTRPPTPAPEVLTSTPDGRIAPPRALDPFLRRAVRGRAPRTKRADSTPITPLVTLNQSGVRAGRRAKLGYVIAKAEEAKAAGRTLALWEVLGAIVTDDRGKDHIIDRGAINGMVSRNHVKLGE